MGENQMDENQMNQEKIKKAWQTMTLGQKIEYLWMYYKSWLFAAILLIGVACMGGTMYKNTHTDVLLDIAVVGGNNLKAEWLQESFAEYAGIEEKDGIIRVRANIPEENDEGTVDSKSALTTLMGAEAVDVLVCSESIYESYQKQDAFLSMQDVLGEDTGKYARTVEYAVVLEPGNILESEEMTNYEPVYVAVPVTSQNKEMAVRFLEYLSGQ